jgi:hypothetical protein
MIPSVHRVFCAHNSNFHHINIQTSTTMQSVLSTLISHNDEGCRLLLEGSNLAACNALRSASHDRNRLCDGMLHRVGVPAAPNAEELQGNDFLPTHQQDFCIYARPRLLGDIGNNLTGPLDLATTSRVLAMIDFAVYYNNGLAQHSTAIELLQHGPSPMAQQYLSSAIVFYSMALALCRTIGVNGIEYRDGEMSGALYNNLAHVSLMQGDIALALSYIDDLIGSLSFLILSGHISTAQEWAATERFLQNILHVHSVAANTPATI